MSVAVAKQRSDATTIPDDIESPRAKLVYLYLATAGRSTVDDLAADLDMPKLALFSVLGTLVGCDAVATDGDAYRLT